MFKIDETNPLERYYRLNLKKNPKYEKSLHNSPQTSILLSTISKKEDPGKSRSHNTWLPENHSYKTPTLNSKNVTSCSKSKQNMSLKQKHGSIDPPNKNFTRHDTSRKSDFNRKSEFKKKAPNSFEFNCEPHTSK